MSMAPGKTSFTLQSRELRRRQAQGRRALEASSSLPKEERQRPHFTVVGKRLRRSSLELL